MRNRILKTACLAIMFIFVGLIAYVFATPGAGHGNCKGCPNAKGTGIGSYYLQGLTGEKKSVAEKEISAFLEATDNIRKNICDTKRELINEMSKKQPGKKTALKLQKKLSKLKAKLDKKQIEHLINLKTINPDSPGTPWDKKCPFMKGDTKNRPGCQIKQIHHSLYPKRMASDPNRITVL